MKRTRLVILAVLIALLIVAVPVVAQTGGGYDLTWNTIDGGGDAASGGSFSLTGTIGQTEAGAMSGGSYTMTGGFWGVENTYSLYLPLVMR